MRRTTTTTTAGVAVLAATLLLTGCTGGDAGPSPEPTVTETTTVTPTASPTPTDGAAPTPGPTPTTAPVASIPTDCTDVVDAATYASTFGETPLNPEEFGDAFGPRTPTAPPAGASGWEIQRAVSELSCLWRDPRADITGIGVDLGRVAPDQAEAITTWAQGQGYTCGPAHGGTSCQLVTDVEQYPVQRAQTFFVRDGVMVHVDQTNFPTDDLLGSISARLWG